MRARIEAAQRRQSQHRARRLCLWSVTLAALIGVGFLLRSRPVPVVSISQHAHEQDGDTAVVLPSVAAAISAKAASAAKVLAEQQSDKDKQQGKEKHYYFTGEGDHMERHELLDEPIPGDCHPETAADYGGQGLSWGIKHKTASAAACCSACWAARSNGCNAWVWCGDPSGICWTPDAWNHTTGACWLKRQENWDGETDLEKTNLVVNARGNYSAEFRAEHKEAPKRVAWISGVITA